MVDFGNALSSVTNQTTYMSALWVAAGYVSSAVLRNVLETRFAQNVPDEAYGMASIALADSFGKRNMKYGGALFTVHMAARRFGVESTVMNLGSGATGA